MSVSFTYDVTTVVMRDPFAPYGPEEPPRQKVTKSGGGVIRTATLGDPDHIIPLDFRNIPTSEWEDMRDFIRDTLNYSALTCTYTDMNSTAHTGMRYMGGIKTARQDRRGGRWSVALVFHKDLGA